MAAKLKKATHEGPKTMELTFMPYEKMPRTYKHVTGYGILDGALCLNSDDGKQKTNSVIVLKPGDEYYVDVTNVMQ